MRREERSENGVKKEKHNNKPLHTTHTSLKRTYIAYTFLAESTSRCNTWKFLLDGWNGMLWHNAESLFSAAPTASWYEDLQCNISK